MRINSTTKITGKNIVLVPYRAYHVIKYNQWMSSKEMQELTSSEPLSLSEEYEMQVKWLTDEDKLTFLILRRDYYENNQLKDIKEKELLSMIGDVNIFLYKEDGKIEAELEVMIVDKENRGRGAGKEAVSLMMIYASQNLKDLSSFFVKIDDTNEASISLFKKLGFVQYEYVKAFKQVSLKFELNDQTWPLQSTPHLDIDSNYF
jgi:RimJ/RimL family protein N-acetyltransferase